MRVALLFAAAAADYTWPRRENKGPQAIFGASPSDPTAPGPGPNGLAKTPPMGWMSWEIFRCETDCEAHPDSCINDKLYEQMADHMAADGYRQAGYNQVSIDDCWANITGRVNGTMVPDTTRFPKGMKAVGDHLHARGVLFGTYSDEGTKTCGGYPGSKGYEQQDAETFASWGVDYLKLDGCYNDKPGFVTGYPAMGTALQGTKRNITYSCSWPAYLGDDETSKPFAAMVDAGCNSWRNWADIQCSWGSLSSIIEHWGKYGEYLAKYAGPGRWHDMDMLLIGNNCVTLEEEKTQMAIWAISASPLIMGNDLRNVSEASKAVLLNKDAIAVSQDKLGKMGFRLNATSTATQVWGRLLSNGDVAVALYNAAGRPTPPIPVAPCPSWTKTTGGYVEACGGAEGNIGSFQNLTVEQAQASCCENSLCAGFDYNRESKAGYYKGNQKCGVTTNSKYDGYSKPSQIPAGAASVTVNFADVGLQGAVSVYDIWAGKSLGTFHGSYTAESVGLHASAFVRLSEVSEVVV